MRPVTHSVQLYYSFRSPYSYLALPKTLKLVAAYDLAVEVRPVYPLAVRDPTFFKRTNPKFARYVVMDSTRVAQAEGIPFRFPRPDPIVQNMETLEVAPEQPRIRRVTRLAAAAQMRGESLAFTWAVAQVLWDGHVNQWHEGDHIAQAITRAGLDAAALERAITDDEAGCDARIAENEAAHAASGHWGVPTFVYEGDPFFGQDRIDLLAWRLKQKGLAAR